MRSRLFFLAALALGAGILGWMLCAVEWEAFARALAQARWPWFVACLAALFASFFTRILRWRYAVRAVKPEATFRQMFSATQIGFLVNFILPARLGEVARAAALGRLARIPFAQGMALAALDRVLDLIGLLATMLVALAAFTPRGDLRVPGSVVGAEADIVIPEGLMRAGAAGFAAVALAAIMALVLIFARLDWFLRINGWTFGLVSRRFHAWIERQARLFADGLRVFRRAGDLLKSVGFSLLTWGLFVAGNAFLGAAFAIPWPWHGPFVMLAGIALFISIPGAPGFVGEFHLAVVASLKLLVPELDYSIAMAVAVVLHLANLFLAVGLGVFALLIEGFSLSQMIGAARHSAE